MFEEIVNDTSSPSKNVVEEVVNDNKSDLNDRSLTNISDLDKDMKTNPVESSPGLRPDQIDQD